MQKKFVSSLLLLLFLNFLVKPIWIFGIDLTVQNRVGAESYGLYAAIFSFTLIFNIILDLGLTHYNNTAIARNENDLGRNFSQLTGIKFLLGFIYLLVALLAGYFLNYTSRAFWLLFILAVNQFLASLQLFMRSHLSGLHLFWTDALMSVLDKMLMIITCGLLLFANILHKPFTILQFAGAQMISYLVAVLIGFFTVLPKAGSFHISINFNDFLDGLKKGFPFALLILLMAMYTRVDSIMLEQISGPFENGIYAQAFRLLDVVNQLGYLFSVILLPMFSRMFARKESVANLTRLAFNIIFVVTVAISFSCFFFAPNIMSTLYVENASLSTPVFRLLIMSSIAFSSTYVFGTLLTARGNLRLLNYVAGSGFLMNIILNACLIPRYGAVGASIATVFTQFLTAFIQMLLSLKIAGLYLKASYWLQLLLFVVLALGVSFALQYFHGSNRWILYFVLNGICILLLSLVLRLFNLKSAIDLVRSRFR